MNIPDPCFPLQLTKNNNKTPTSFFSMLNSATVSKISFGKGKRQRDVFAIMSRREHSETRSVPTDWNIAVNNFYPYNTKKITSLRAIKGLLSC